MGNGSNYQIAASNIDGLSAERIGDSLPTSDVHLVLDVSIDFSSQHINRCFSLLELRFNPSESTKGLESCVNISDCFDLLS